MRFFKMLIVLFFVGTGPALAADPLETLHFIGRYDFDFSGIYLGNIVLGIDETSDNYNMHLLVRSGGIVNLFTRHMSDTEASGTRAGDNYHPHHYESRYKTKDKPRHIKVTFDAKGIVTEEINEPPEDRNDRPEVPHALKDGAYDPLSLLMAVRAGTTRLRGFDGKRLYEVTAERLRPSTAKIVGHYGVLYGLARKPLAGMTAKEMKEYNKGEPQLLFDFSDDKARVPLGISVPAYFGRVTGVLTKECKSWEECVN